MTREDVLAVVTRHLTEVVDGLDPAALDPTRSMADYGANSLDLFDVVSGAMHEMDVKVPRSELTRLDTIDGLVTLLHNIKSGTGMPA